MLNSFEKDIFQRILANYSHSQAGLQDPINDLCSDCSKKNSGRLFYQLCFYARFKCICYEDAVPCFFPVAHQLWKRAKSLADEYSDASVDVASCFSVCFHDLVWKFVTLLSSHQDWFEDILVMNELALPFNGWLGGQDYSYHDHFGAVNYPTSYCGSEEKGTAASVLSGRSYTRNAQLLSFPTALFSYLEDHVEKEVFLEPDFQSDFSIAICSNAKRWLQTVLLRARENGDECEILQIEDLLTNIADHVRFVKLQVTY